MILSKFEYKVFDREYIISPYLQVYKCILLATLRKILNILDPKEAWLCTLTFWELTGLNVNK